MKTININLSLEKSRTRLLRFFSPVLLSVAIVYSLYAVINIVTLNSDQANNIKLEENLDKELASFDADLKNFSTEKLKGLKKEALYVNSLIERKSFSWVEILKEIEKSKPKTLLLKSLSPNVKSREIRLTGETSSLDDVFLFVENLNKNASFKESVLSRHSVNRNNKVEFNISLYLKK